MVEPVLGAVPVVPAGTDQAVTDAMRIGDGTSEVCDAFRRDLWTRDNANVLEIGTLRADPEVATHHREWARLPEHYVMADITSGPDVDVVTDAHALDFVGGQFSAVIAVAVWEHLARPGMAAAEVARVLHAGGIAYISSHHTFPLHSYGPTGEGDYFRFSRSALELLFTDVGLEVVASGYMYPCQIVPPPDVASGRWNPGAPAWLVVDGYFRKP